MSRGDAETGVATLCAAIDVLHSRRYELLATTMKLALTEGLLMRGQYERALLNVDEATARVESNGDVFHKPELLRLKGNILSSMPGADAALAEAYYLESLELAGRLSVRAWELRTATSLTLLWSPQNRIGEAREVLAPVVGRFTEGFSTRDLLSARRLLEQLG